MRVGVDGRSLVGGGARGVAHYTAALLGALAADFPGDEWRVLLPRGPVLPLPPGLEPVRHALPSRALFGAAAVLRRPRLERLVGGCDIVWVPAPAPLAVGRGTPLVVTVHDRSWELRPGDFTRYERAWHVLARPRALAGRAARVLCPSEAVRRELLDVWGLQPERVVATPLAPAVVARPSAAPARRYFLFVGALEPRKGPDVLVEAYRRARGLDADLLLVGTGRLAPRLSGEGVGLLARVDDSTLAGLYAGALALVMPSWLEGFGLPAVEALRHGAPVIASDLPVLREVLGGEGALYVPPGDPDALAGALAELAGDAAARARLLERGRAHTAALDWRETARRTRGALVEAAR